MDHKWRPRRRRRRMATTPDLSGNDMPTMSIDRSNKRRRMVRNWTKHITSSSSSTSYIHIIYAHHKHYHKHKQQLSSVSLIVESSENQFVSIRTQIYKQQSPTTKLKTTKMMMMMMMMMKER